MNGGLRSFVLVLIVCGVLGVLAFSFGWLYRDKNLSAQESVGTVSAGGTTYMPNECRRIWFPAQFGGDLHVYHYFYDPFADTVYVLPDGSGSKAFILDKKNILYTPWVKQMDEARQKCAVAVAKMEADAKEHPIQYP